MPGWVGSDRHDRLPADWPTIRRRILARDQYACRWVRADTGRRCMRVATEVDHINAGDDHRDANLQALCHWHHLRKSGGEGGRASGVARAAKRAKPAAHPGLA